MAVYCQPWLSEVRRIRFAVLYHIRVDYNKVLCMWLTLSGRFDSLAMIKDCICTTVLQKKYSTPQARREILEAPEMFDGCSFSSQMYDCSTSFSCAQCGGVT